MRGDTNPERLTPLDAVDYAQHWILCLRLAWKISGRPSSRWETGFGKARRRSGLNVRVDGLAKRVLASSRFVSRALRARRSSGGSRIGESSLRRGRGG